MLSTGDPLVLQWVRIDAVSGLVGLMDEALHAARTLEPAALILYGAHERVIPRRAPEALTERVAPGHKLRIYPPGFHTLLRDRQAAVVLKDLRHWIRETAYRRTMLPGTGHGSQAMPC